jgi:hypothetical protein
MRRSIIVFSALAIFSSCADQPSSPAATSTDTMSHESHAMAQESAPALEPVPDNAKVFFKNIKTGDLLTSPFKVEMGVENMSVDTANGKIKPASGHHHILIGLDSVAAGTVVPKDSVHLHFGNAQTSTEIKLPSGTYKLTLQFADALHRSYGSRLTNSVIVKVK